MEIASPQRTTPWATCRGWQRHCVAAMGAKSLLPSSCFSYSISPPMSGRWISRTLLKTSYLAITDVSSHPAIAYVQSGDKWRVRSCQDDEWWLDQSDDDQRSLCKYNCKFQWQESMCIDIYISGTSEHVNQVYWSGMWGQSCHVRHTGRCARAIWAALISLTEEGNEGMCGPLCYDRPRKTSTHGKLDRQ